MRRSQGMRVVDVRVKVAFRLRPRTDPARTSLLRFGGFDVAIGRGGIGNGFRFGRFLGRPKVPGAVVPAIFNIVILGKRRDHCGASSDLANAVENDFRAPVVEFHQAVNFDGAPGQTANIANIL